MGKYHDLQALTRQAILTNIQDWTVFPIHPNYFLESGSNQHYINPLNQRDFLQKLRVGFLLSLIFDFIMICRQRRTHLNPQPYIQHHSHNPSQPQRKEESLQSSGLCPGYFKNKKKQFVRMQPAFLTSLKNIHTITSRNQSPISGSI